MGTPSSEASASSSRSRGRNFLLGCLAGCGGLALLAISSCLGFVWWVNRPAELLEPGRLRGPETTAYLEWTLRLEDPGTAAFVEELLASMQRLQRDVPGVLPGPLGGMLASYQSRRNEQQLKQLFPCVVAWSVLSAPDPAHEQHLVTLSIEALGNRTVLIDWVLGWLLDRDKDTEVVEHGGEKIYRLKKLDSAFFLRRGQIFFTTGLEGAELAVDRLQPGAAGSAEATPLDRLIDALPADRPLRGATTNEHGEVARLIALLLEDETADALAGLPLEEVRGATVHGGFGAHSRFEATLDVLGVAAEGAEDGLARLAAALSSSLSTESIPVQVEATPQADGVRLVFAVDNLPGLLERLGQRVREDLRHERKGLE